MRKKKAENTIVYDEKEEQRIFLIHHLYEEALLDEYDEEYKGFKEGFLDAFRELLDIPEKCNTTTEIGAIESLVALLKSGALLKHKLSAYRIDNARAAVNKLLMAAHLRKTYPDDPSRWFYDWQRYKYFRGKVTAVEDIASILGIKIR